ncbi:MAG: histidine kinase dimerization/phosphoacceptor domain -containing protein [Phormidesmis sp.]
MAQTVLKKGSSVSTDETLPNMLILVVDDEPTTRLLLRVAMQKEGFEVIEASNGKESLARFREHRPDIVLLDAIMPEMDGFSCCTALQEISGKMPVPVLMITGLDDAASIERVFAAGATDYAAKPIHWPLLRQRVRNLRTAVEHQRAEQKIEASLKEKEVLLKEIHHRVKNNLQIVSSLLNLQANAIEDENIAALFQESQNRVRLMALIHEKLYQANDLGKIDLGDYIQVLSSYLMCSYSVKSEHVKLAVEADDLFLEVDAAVSCGLIINELVTNTLKYAFPNGEAGRIAISVKRMDQTTFAIHYADSGIGLPRSLDIVNAKTLGLQLIYSLCEQLGGDLEMGESNLSESPGAYFKLSYLSLSR